jgi:hypothetical protein
MVSAWVGMLQLQLSPYSQGAVHVKAYGVRCAQQVQDVVSWLRLNACSSDWAGPIASSRDHAWNKDCNNLMPSHLLLLPPPSLSQAGCHYLI